MFEKLRRISAVTRLVDEKLYEQVHSELLNGQKRNGLWVKALANSDGIEEKANALYIKYRFQSIKDEMEIADAIVEEAERLVEPEHQRRHTEFTSERQKRVNNCETLLHVKSNKFRLKANGAGWTVYEPLGGRVSINTIEELELYARTREKY